ncbi:MAG: glycosyltransferase [Deltaproteobacteria bacterium]|nr:glycosyltransferase [Deltaproteobacteria bacterium]
MNSSFFSAKSLAALGVFAFVCAPWTPILFGWRLVALASGAWLVAVTARRILLAWAALRRDDTPRSHTDGARPTLLALVPARNEAGVLAEFLGDLVTLDWPAQRRKIVVIDDGSTDATGAIAASFADRGVEVLRREGHAAGRGKPAALNAALAAIDFGEWVYVVDADARIAPDAPARLVDAATRVGAAAAQGMMAVRNADRSSAAAFAAMESLVHQDLTQVGAMHTGASVMLLGSNYVVRRDRLERFDGFREDTRLEDVDLCVTLQARGDAVVFEPEARSSILACEDAGDGRRQHRDWSSAFRDIARRRWTEIWVGPLTFWRKVDLTLLATGYFDRAALALYALCLVAGWRAETFVAPCVVLEVYLLVAFAQLVLAWRRLADSGVRLPIRDLAALVLGDLVDHAAANLDRAGSTAWQRTRRTGDD